VWQKLHQPWLLSFGFVSIAIQASLLMAQPAARLPVPAEADQQVAAKKVREVYGRDIDGATNAAQKRALAKDMLATALSTKDDAAARFTLFQTAGRLAAEAGDFDLARSIVEATAKEFDVDAQTGVMSMLKQAEDAASTPAAHSLIAKEGLKLIDELMNAGHFGLADEAGRIAFQAAKKSQDKSLLKELAEKQEQLAGKRRLVKEESDLLQRLKNSPDDRDANRRYGELLCFEKQQWPAGLAHLAKSNSPLAPLALRELKELPTSEAKFALAEDWRKAATDLEAGPQLAALWRATCWYRKSLAGTSGLTQLRIKKAIEDLQPQVSKFEEQFAGVVQPSTEATIDLRKRLVAENGGTEASEAAVAAALKWLAQHQRPDGGWSFDHRNGPCKSNPGGLDDAFNGATGMALLPFLGAGETHKHGQYKENVKLGLAYLIRAIKLKPGAGGAARGTLEDAGTFYSHGICAITLGEAYALTRDRELLAPLQTVIDHIVYAQDPVGGGWRYVAKQPGDTSVTAWQVAALTTASAAGLKVPAETTTGAAAFLTSVQVDGGAGYGYTSPADGPTTTACGVLCRSMLDGEAKGAARERALEKLSKMGPSKSNSYYNYYATQVLRQEGGAKWTKWNDVLREQLVKSQSKDGAEAGSWYIPGDHGAERGGRIYCTVMATLVLESYYRHRLKE
jgi:hypothetical protein